VIIHGCRKEGDGLTPFGPLTFKLPLPNGQAWSSEGHG